MEVKICFNAVTYVEFGLLLWRRAAGSLQLGLQLVVIAVFWLVWGTIGCNLEHVVKVQTQIFSLKRGLGWHQKRPDAKTKV